MGVPGYQSPISRWMFQEKNGYPTPDPKVRRIASDVLLRVREEGPYLLVKKPLYSSNGKIMEMRVPKMIGWGMLGSPKIFDGWMMLHRIEGKANLTLQF